MAPHTVKLVPEEDTSSPEYYRHEYDLFSDEERELMRAKAHEKEMQRYEGPHGDLFFVFDLMKGLEKIELELPIEAYEAFFKGEIGRMSLIEAVQHSQGE